MIRRLAPVALAALVLSVACTDLLGPLAESDSVRLVVRPSFAEIPANIQGDNPASQVDNVHIVLRNAAGAIVVDEIVEWPLGQDTLRLDVDVTVSGSESFEMTIEGRAADRILFQAGPMSVQLSSEGGSTVEANPVLEYAGPGAGVSSIEIINAPASFRAGSDVQLRVSGANSDGTAADDLILIWTSLDTAAAKVGESGTVQVGHNAARAVSIEARVAFTSIADTIQGPVLPSSLDVTPGSSTLTALGAELAVHAAPLGADGGEVRGVDIVWEVVDPAVIDIAASGGSATATAVATGATWAVAAAGGLTDSVRITVVQEVETVEVEPGEATLDRVGSTVRATADAFDANGHEVPDAAIEWSPRSPTVATVSDDGTITGASPGSAWVVASSGGAADSLLTTVLNVDPEIAIRAPSDGGAFDEGETITFEGGATDLEDGELSSSIEWISSVSGDIGAGATVADSLEPGSHTITAAVTDSHGATVSTAIQITVLANTPPEVAIESPADGATGAYGTAVTLSASASDEQDGDLSSSIEWSSGLDGGLGTGSRVSLDDLTIGTHTITATVSDSRGLDAAATRTLEVTNNAPTVRIAAPEDGATFDEGASITFDGTAEDTEDGGLSGEIRWSSDVAGDLGTGARVSAALEPGSHTVTATVADSHGDGTSMSVDVSVAPNTPPVISITTPSEAVTVSYDSPLTLEATAQDAQDGSLSSSIQWSSGTAGALGTGSSITTSALEMGTHTITASVTDSRGLEGTATRTVEVVNSAPTVSITSPSTGATYDEGEAVTLEGTASDVEDGALSGSIQWSSDVDGSLGAGGSVTAEALSTGRHTITATVTDSRDGRASAAIEVTVSANTPPAVTITAPEEGTTISFGSALTLTGSASDEQDGDLSGSIEWSSSLDGGLETGSSVSIDDLTIGTHTITATVADSRGLEDAATRTVEVTNNAPTVSITSPSTGSVFSVGSAIEFAATATDAEDDDAMLSESIRWLSSIDGEFGGGVTSTLSEGLHTIIAHVADQHEAEAVDSITITVGGSEVTGRVSYSTEGVEGAGVVLSSQVDGGPADQNTTTASDGSYRFSGVHDGTYMLQVVQPDEFTGVARAAVVEITGANINQDFALQKELTRVAPNDGDPVSGNPSLEWQPFTGADWYQVRVTVNGDLVDQGYVTSGTTHTVDAAVLVDGQSYRWTVNAYDQMENWIGASVGSHEFAFSNTAPSIAISPRDTSLFWGEAATFAGSATDPENGTISADIEWSIRPADSTGSVMSSGGAALDIDTSLLEAKQSYIVTARVTDSHGLEAADSVSLNVKNNQPGLTIHEPTDSAELHDGGNQYRASVTDKEDGSGLATAIDWFLNEGTMEEEQIASGAEPIIALPIGTHLVSARVADSHAAIDKSAITVTVVAATPVLEVTSPVGGQIFEASDTVRLNASASDPVDGDLTSKIVWTLSGDPVHTGTDGMLSLGTGSYLIEVRVTNSREVTTQQQIEITVK